MSWMQKNTMQISHHRAKYRLFEPSIANTIVNSNLYQAENIAAKCRYNILLFYIICNTNI